MNIEESQIKGQRLAKAISNSGLCSRRMAEQLIKDGKVSINGVIVTSVTTNTCSHDKITISGQLLQQNITPRLWSYYKPIGLITTHNDPQKRCTVFATLPSYMPRVISVGRLDINSEGLLLLTNNSQIARYFELPMNKIERVYKVRAFGNPNSLLSFCDLLSKGLKSLVIDDISYRPQAIRVISSSNKNSWFEVTLTEGKNREVRKIFEHFNLQVNRLIRTKFGPFSLRELKNGECREEIISKELSLLSLQAK
jgi:23S rRNA pseudouridine2605 synthase